MKQDAHVPKPKNWARLLYTQHDYSIEDIALETGAEEATIKNWIADDEWDKIKVSMLISRNAQLKRLYSIMELLHKKMQQPDHEITSKDADLFIKYTNAVKNVEGELTNATAIEACGKFFIWLHRANYELAMTVSEYFNDYVKHITSPLNV